MGRLLTCYSMVSECDWYVSSGHLHFRGDLHYIGNYMRGRELPDRYWRTVEEESKEKKAGF